MSIAKPEIIGETFDGIKILKPVTAPTSFTVDEIRETVADVMRDFYQRLDDPDPAEAEPEADADASAAGSKAGGAEGA